MNEWYHLACTFRDGEVRIYVNGEEGSYTPDGKGDPMLVMPSGYVKHVQVGSDYNKAFGGVMDEVRIYNDALTPEQIKAIFEYQP
jgi:capsule polysaccharide export protein KpsC/LpsZ